MLPSRRETLKLCSLAALPVSASCTESNAGDTEPGTTAQPPETQENAEFEVHLDGPDGEQMLFDASGIATVDSIQEHEGKYLLPITLTEEGASHVSEIFRTAGVAENPDVFEVVHYRNGEEVQRLEVAPNLTEAIADGEWDGEIMLLFQEREEAADLRDDLAKTGNGVRVLIVSSSVLGRTE